jgi:glutathione S-transferase
MPKILCSPASPFAAKARMAAVYAGYAFEPVLTKTDDVPAELIAANPLGKIPALVTDDGKGIFDSKVITRFLNRATGGKLLPRNAVGRLEAEMLESLADGICDWTPRNTLISNEESRVMMAVGARGVRVLAF